MNGINYALRRIFAEIPIELLNMAFPAMMQYGMTDNRSLEERVRSEVMLEKVSIDANLVGGQVTNVDISGLSMRFVEDGFIITVPLSRTQGRKIILPFSADMGDQFATVGGYGGSLVNKAASMTQGRIDGPQVSSNSNVRIIGPNTFHIGGTSVTGYTNLRCLLENDKNFANIGAKAHIKFGKLSVLAAKSIIYTRLVIAAGDGSINGGNVNGYIRQLIDEYADAAELYEEFLTTKWQKAAAFNDHRTRRSIERMGLYR